MRLQRPRRPRDRAARDGPIARRSRQLSLRTGNHGRQPSCREDGVPGEARPVEALAMPAKDAHVAFRRLGPAIETFISQCSEAAFSD